MTRLPIVYSRMACILARVNIRGELAWVAAKARAATTSAQHFSTLTPKNLWLEGSSVSEQKSSLPLAKRAIDSDKSSFLHFTSSSPEDPSHYNARWRKALHKTTSTSRIVTDRKRSGWSTTITATASSSMDEFDPILSIRAANPLMFENNYDLDEYGASFRNNCDSHAAVIQEWRIRHENVA